jgi:hypothetical protein
MQKQRHLTWGLAQYGRTEALFQLLVFQFGFCSGWTNFVGL